MAPSLHTPIVPGARPAVAHSSGGAAAGVQWPGGGQGKARGQDGPGET